MKYLQDLAQLCRVIVRRDVTNKAPGRLEEEIVSCSTSQNLLLLSKLHYKYPGNARNIEIERCCMAG